MHAYAWIDKPVNDIHEQIAHKRQKNIKHLHGKCDFVVVCRQCFKIHLPDAVDYEERILTLKEAIESFNDDNIPPLARNRLLKSIIKKIEYSTPLNQPRGVNDYSIEITLNV